MAQVRKEQVQLQVVVNGKQVSNTIKDLQKEYRSLERQRQSLQIGSEEYKKVATEAAKVKGLIDETRITVKGVNTGVDSLSKGFAGLKGNIAAAFNPFTLLLTLGAVAFQFVQKLVQSVGEMQKLRGEVASLTGLTGEGLNAVSAQVSAISKVLKVGTSDLVQAGQAATNAFGGELAGNLDLIEKGLLLTQERGGEFLEQVKEYSVQFRQAGFSAEEAFAIIADGINTGVFTDKAADAIKEFNLRIKDLSTAQRESLEKLVGPEAADQLVSGIEKGSIKASDALGIIGDRIGELGPESALAQQAVSNLFGGAGEDAGLQFIATLGNARKGLDELIDGSNEYVKRQQDVVESQRLVEVETARLSAAFDGFGEGITILGNQYLAYLIARITDIANAIIYFPDYFRAALNAGKEFANGIIGFVEPLIQKFSLLGVIFEKITGRKLELPKFETNSEDTFAGVGQKINADRAKFEAEQDRKEKEAQKKREEEAKKNSASLTSKQVDAAREDARKLQEVIRSSRLALTDAILDLDAAAAEEIEESSRKLFGPPPADETSAEFAAYLNARREALAQSLSTLDALAKEDALRITQEVAAAAEAGTIEVGEIQEVLTERLGQLNEEYLNRRRQAYLDNGDSLVEIDQQITDAQIANLERLAQEQAQIDQARKDNLIAGLQTASEFVQGGGDLLTAIGDRQLAQIEARKQAEIAAAGDSAKARENIEKRYAAEVEKIERKQNQRRKAQAIIQSIINTAVAITEALPNPVAATLAGVLGAIQTAAIAAQPFAVGGMTNVDTGQRLNLMDGRPMRASSGGTVNRPRMAVVGEKGAEWIAPNWMMRSKTYGPMIGSLENARVRGFATGGATAPASISQAAQDAAMSQALITEIQGLRGDVRALKLTIAIGEKEAAAISDVQTTVAANRQNTGL